METIIKLPTAQAILLSNSFLSDPSMLALMHTGGSKQIDEMFDALNKTGDLQSFIDAIEPNGHEFAGKLQDTKFLNAEDVDNSKALQSLFTKMISKSSTTEDLSTIHAAFTAVNDIEKTERIQFEAFGKNADEDQILSSENSVKKTLYETITKDPEFLRVKTDKFLSDNERQEKIADITLGYLNPNTLNHTISEMAERMMEIREAHKNPVDIDKLMANMGRLRESTAFLNSINENGSTESLFENVEAAQSEITEMANNSVEETRGVDRAFSYDYDKKMTEAVTSNPQEVTVEPSADFQQGNSKNEGHSL
jgi:hypothetical protein